MRYSIENPSAYVDSNLVGFGNILEGVRHAGCIPLVYASSSSVYGENDKLPFSEIDRVDQPMSLYAATKRSNELMAHAYGHLYGLLTAGLRFFTVYGPWGRPDMALFKFTKAILGKQAVPLYNRGNMVRDFTYIDDIVSGVIKALNKKPKKNKNWNPKKPDPSTGIAPFKIINLGSSKKIKLMDEVTSKITQNIDTLWVINCAILVFIMQAGFMCMESGLSRHKNSINVALKNAADFGVSVVMFWILGFGFMFGKSFNGFIGTDLFLSLIHI